MGFKKPRGAGRPRSRQNALGRWIDEKSGRTREQVAKALGIEKPSLDRLCRGERRPSLDLALSIEKMTNSKVPAVSWQTVPPHSKD